MTLHRKIISLHFFSFLHVVGCMTLFLESTCGPKIKNGTGIPLVIHPLLNFDLTSISI